MEPWCLLDLPGSFLLPSVNLIISVNNTTVRNLSNKAKATKASDDGLWIDITSQQRYFGTSWCLYTTIFHLKSILSQHHHTVKQRPIYKLMYYCDMTSIKEDYLFPRFNTTVSKSINCKNLLQSTLIYHANLEALSVKHHTEQAKNAKHANWWSFKLAQFCWIQLCQFSINYKMLTET